MAENHKEGKFNNLGAHWSRLLHSYPRTSASRIPQEHVQRLEKIFQALGESPKGKKCKGMEGLIEEGSEAVEEEYEGSVKDAALIGAAQRVQLERLQRELK